MTDLERRVFAPITEWIRQNCFEKKSINRKAFWLNNYYLKQRATRETGLYVDSFQFHQLLTDVGFRSVMTNNSNDPLERRWVYNIR